MRRRRLAWMSALVLMLGTLPAFSQSCALCYTQAASAGARVIQALRSGILILVIPPMLMTIGFFRLAYRKRRQFHTSEDALDNDWSDSPD